MVLPAEMLLVLVGGSSLCVKRAALLAYCTHMMKAVLMIQRMQTVLVVVDTQEVR